MSANVEQWGERILSMLHEAAFEDGGPCAECTYHIVTRYPGEPVERDCTARPVDCWFAQNVISTMSHKMTQRELQPK